MLPGCTTTSADCSRERVSYAFVSTVVRGIVDGAGTRKERDHAICRGASYQCTICSARHSTDFGRLVGGTITSMTAHFYRALRAEASTNLVPEQHIGAVGTE